MTCNIKDCPNRASRRQTMAFNPFGGGHFELLLYFCERHAREIEEAAATGAVGT